MELNRAILCDQNFDIHGNCFNALGVYNSMQFVLRLSYSIRKKMEVFNGSIGSYSDYSDEEIQAYSVYFHETVHWWQHIGSISGFILSFSFPSQAHVNIEELRKFINEHGTIKPVKEFHNKNSSYENQMMIFLDQQISY